MQRWLTRWDNRGELRFTGAPWARVCYNEQITNNTTIASHGFPAPTVAGTPSVVKDSTGERISYASAAGGSCGWFTNIDAQPRMPYIWAGTIWTPSDLTNLRAWCGLFLADPATSDDPATHLAGVRYSQGVDTTWKFCTKDGSTLDTVDSGITVAVDTRYEVLVDTTQLSISGYLALCVLGPSSYKIVQMNGNLPGNTQNLDSYLRGRDKGGAGVSLGMSKVQVCW